MYGIKAELMNYISKSLSILAAALFMVLARAAVIVRAQAAESAKPVALEGVMEKLERDMQAVIGAISKEDWTMVAQPAPKIARRAKPPLPEKMRILGWLAADAGKFLGFDGQLHDAAVAMGEAATRGDRQEVIAALGKVQQRCLGYHQSFREPFVKHFYGKRWRGWSTASRRGARALRIPDGASCALSSASNRGAPDQQRCARRQGAGDPVQPRRHTRIADRFPRHRLGGTPLSGYAALSTSLQNLVLVLNCGSSSIKFAVFPVHADPLPRNPLWNGKVQGIGGPTPDFGETGAEPFPVELDAEHPHTAALQLIQERVSKRLDGRRVTAVAHRVVHGGNRYSAPTLVTLQMLNDLRSYIPLAPLHQPFPLKAMGLLLKQRPDIVQVASFDTTFHHTLPKVEQILPLPYSAWERGLRRYGFHGLSYDYMSHVLPERHGDLGRGRTIVAHLGSGASLCAMKNLQSVATTMGFSALDGLMMGTRTGSLDPGALLYLMEIEKLSLEEVGRTLYNQSGLLGVSGISAEPRVVVKHEDDPGEAGERARIALELYVRRIVREIGALTAVLGGLDLLAFTAGVGEHNAFVRERVCRDLAYLGLKLDADANAVDAPIISDADSRVRVVVEPTNEEWIAARHTQELMTAA